ASPLFPYTTLFRSRRHALPPGLQRLPADLPGDPGGHRAGGARRGDPGGGRRGLRRRGRRDRRPRRRDRRVRRLARETAARRRVPPALRPGPPARVLPLVPALLLPLAFFAGPALSTVWASFTDAALPRAPAAA